MYIRERKNKNGVAYQIYISGKDPKTRTPKLYQKTYQLPEDCTGKKKATDKFLLDCQKQFQDEVDKMSLGLANKKEKVKLIDFAMQYIEKTFKDNPQGYHYYSHCLADLKPIEEKLGYYYLHEINQFIVQDFLTWLCKRTYTKIKVTVKKSLRPLIKERKLTLTKIAKDCGIAEVTLYVALDVGKNVNYDTVNKICEFLKVSEDKHFNIEKQELPYSFSANNGVKSLLSSILAKALKRGLVDCNFASKDYTDPVTGKKGEKKIYEGEEIQEFMKCVIAETDIRKKAAFSIMLYLGLRVSEVCGLEWSDFDFQNNEVSIQRSTAYTSEAGTFTKEPKTKNSKAVLSVPQGLMDLLAEYKTWWDNQKIMHGDLWENTDRLFCQNNGKDMVGSTVRNWLNDFQTRYNLKHVTPHGLRHTNITLQIDSGIDIKTVSARARHAKVQTTLDIYTHRTSRGDKKAADTIDQILRVN